MQFAMMCATDGDRVFVADLSSERTGLGKTKMVRVGRHAAADDAGLAGHEFGMLLVAHANGLAHDAAADGADFLRDSRENVDAFCAFDARLCRGSNMDGLDRHFLRLLVGERFHLRPEAVFDDLRNGGRQQVPVGQSPVNPDDRAAGLFGRQNGLRGADDFWLAGANRRRLGAWFERQVFK